MNRVRVMSREVVVGVVAVIAILASALAGIATQKVSHRRALDDARANATAAATSSVATLLSYDYRHLRRDFRRAKALLTPRFAREYDKSTAKTVEPLATENRATSTAGVTSAATVTNSVDRAVVLVFVSQVVTNANLAQPRVDSSRMNVTMVRSGDRWLIDGLLLM